MNDSDRKVGHSALRWNKDRQSLERFDPNSGITDNDCKTFETYGVILTGDPVKDLFAVYSKMVERGEFGKFVEDTYYPWEEKYKLFGPDQGEFMAWLSCYGCPDQISERMSMAAEWIRRRDESDLRLPLA